MTYYDWLREQAQLIHADGCSGVTNIDAICCLEHDLAFYYGKDPAHAYHFARTQDPWWWARPITFEDANTHFRACCFRESRLGYLNLMGWWRYWGVRTKRGRAAWEGHRAREAQTT